MGSGHLVFACLLTPGSCIYLGDADGAPNPPPVLAPTSYRGNCATQVSQPENTLPQNQQEVHMHGHLTQQSQRTLVGLKWLREGPLLFAVKTIVSANGGI